MVLELTVRLLLSFFMEDTNTVVQAGTDAAQHIANITGIASMGPRKVSLACELLNGHTRVFLFHPPKKMKLRRALVFTSQKTAPSLSQKPFFVELYNLIIHVMRAERRIQADQASSAGGRSSGYRSRTTAHSRKAC